MWIRTCQECGHKQEATQPPKDKELSDSYRNAKCKKCKSSALDYGKYLTDPDMEEPKDELE